MDGEQQQPEPAGSPSGQLLHVVYDPSCDRFFLQDDAPPAARGSSQRDQTACGAGVPWSQWALPPKSTSKEKQAAITTSGNRTAEVSVTTESLPAGDQSAQVPTCFVHDDAVFKSEAPVPSSEPPQYGGKQQPLADCLPPLDLSSLTQKSSRVSEELLSAPSRAKASKQRKAATPKKARVRDYADHFARANANLPDSMHATPQAQEIRWNGNLIRVKVVVGNAPMDLLVVVRQRGRRHAPKCCGASAADAHASARRRLPRGQRWLRVHALDIAVVVVVVRGRAATFVVFSEGETLPVFHRGDRVLFRAWRRRFKGTIARRVRKSDFYDVKAVNGTVFLAISAMRIRLLPEEERHDEVPKHYNFERSDRVLWQDPTHTRQTYKARVVRPWSWNRFDIQLRTGRIVPKVPCEELRPRSYDT